MGSLEFFKVDNPKLGRFYLLPKIHKRLKKVQGRPVISNSILQRIYQLFWINISNL